jgi:zinc transport system substrate-binding protein
MWTWFQQTRWHDMAFRWLILVWLAWPLAGCHQDSDVPREYVVTVAPLAMIVSEIAGDRAAVHILLQPGVSPHTYEPRPSDIRTAERALALFYVDETLDGWAVRLPGANKVAVFPLVPETMRLRWVSEHDESDEHEHGADDPHFWGDPQTVKAVLPGLVEKLSALDPDGAAGYSERAKRFGASLDELDAEMRELMAPVKGEPVVLFHSSWNYFLQRYGLVQAAVVEASPGKEATAQHIAGLADMIKREGIKAVFTEPQLARRPAEVVGEAGGVPVFEIDPLGGVPGKMSYEELIRSNAKGLNEALQ